MKGKEKDLFAEVALSLPLVKHLHYRIPERLQSSVEVGKRVLVPLGKRRVTGYVIGITQKSDVHEVKDVVDILDDRPLFTAKHLSFYRWIGDYYFFPLGGVIKTALPGSINIESKQTISLTEKGVESLALNDNSDEMTLLEKIGKRKRISFNALLRSYKGEGLHALLNRLERKDLIKREFHEAQALVKIRKEKWVKIEKEGYHILQSPDRWNSFKKRAPKQASLLIFLGQRGEASLNVIKKALGHCDPIIKNLEGKGLIGFAYKEIYRDPLHGEEVASQHIPQPNVEQKEIAEKIKKSIATGKYAPFLLYGVTGSGKTEIYIRSIEEVLKQGKEALVLVPEISLTPQLVNQFRFRLGDDMVLLHSRLSPGERYDGWRRIQEGKVKVAIGARSAIFAPFSKLGVIIVDEEHDTSYKQEDKLRYHAKDLALVRAKIENAVVILGSATPSLESYYNSQIGKLTLLRLTSRVEGKPLPTIEIVDMRQGESCIKNGRKNLSNRLKEALLKRLTLHQQSMLFLNRRGFAPFVICWECGYVFSCPNCSVSLIHHQRERHLTCHYCGYTIATPDTCPECGGIRIQLLGWGTERLEEEVRGLFPEAHVERMDRDTTRGKWGHRKVLKRFISSDGGVLIGTQMIAKGHDMPGVTLVGVVSADLSLNFPDFRSSERTFQLLTQVSGRAGRGDIPGEVIIQTFNPHHYSIRNSQHQAFPQFYEEEIKFRKELNYPPFSRLINFKLEGNSKSRAAASAACIGKLAHSLCDQTSSYRKAIEVLGPSASPWEKIKGKYRYQMLVKGSPLPTLRRFASQLMQQIPSSLRGGGVTCYVDVDPVSLL